MKPHAALSSQNRRDPVQVGTFLKSRSHLQVPIYQRNFAWTTSNVDQLWEDLLSTIDGQDESYFLGSMVFVEKDDSTLEVVDGQQRLACLSLLLAVIRDVLKENGGQHASNLETTYLLARSIRGEAAPKLSLNERDNATFRELVEGTICLPILRLDPNHERFLRVTSSCTQRTCSFDRRFETTRMRLKIRTACLRSRRP